MRITLKSRKPVNKLRGPDFRSYPIWEFAIGEEGRRGQDETWVRPVNSGFIPRESWSLLALTEFTTSSGKNLDGFMIVTTAGPSIEVTAGALFGTFGYLVVPNISRKMAEHRQVIWANEARDKLVAALRSPEEKVFPIRYSLSVHIEDESELRTGVLK